MHRAWLLCAMTACSFETRLAPINAAADGPDAADVDAATGAEAMPTPLCDPADLDLRACFTFDNTLQDGSSYGNNVTASLAPVYVTGHAGQSIVTTTGTFTTPSTTSLDITTFTLKLWIKPNAIPAGTARMGLLDSGGRYRLFLQTGGALRCAVTGGADLTSNTGVVAANTWQRVACRYNGSTIAIYVNGTMVASSNQTSTVPATGGGMVIGHNNPSGENFNGAIDELQVWGSLVAP